MPGSLNEAQINNVLSGQVPGRIACTGDKQPKCMFRCRYDDRYGELAMCIGLWPFEELRGAQAEEAREILFGRVFA